MVKKVAAVILALIMTGSGAASAQTALAPEREHYEYSPFNLGGITIPHVLLVLSKNIQMFQQAYPGLADMDGDGRVDTGFNPAVVYTGYFDPYSCYGYTTKNRIWSSSRGAVGDKTGIFVRVGASVPDKKVVDRPTGLKGYVVSPSSATGICKGVTYSGKDSDDTDFNRQGTFSGNWLNYLTTSRMDAIRKILYGGQRMMPEKDDETYLEASFVPADSTAWGTEVMADDIWSSVTPQSAYYDISHYTPFKKPDSGKAHFFFPYP